MRWSIYASPSDYQLESDCLHVLTNRLFSGLCARDIPACLIDNLEQLFLFWFRYHYPNRPVAGLEPAEIVEAFFIYRRI